MLLEVDTDGTDPFYSHPVLHGDRAVGIVTSGAWGHRTGRALALAWLRERGLREGLRVAILGREYRATVLDRPLFDLENARLKF